MTNEEAVKMLRTMQRTIYLGNRKFEDAIECAIKALSEPLQPWEILVAQAVLPQPKRGKWIRDGHHIRCDQCGMCICDTDREGDRIPTEFCPHCGADMREVTE